MRITFIRHGQSEANAAHIWQGQQSTPLTAAGRNQASQLGARLARTEFDLVISSDLERAVDTAVLAGFEPQETLDVWREGDIGEWEGLTEHEVLERFPDEIARLRDGEDISFGGSGESLTDVRRRAGDSLRSLIGRLGSDDHALVVAHGGIVGAAVREVLGLPTTGRFLGIQMNTAITEVDIAEDGEMTLIRYSDAGHLGSLVGFAARMRDEGAVIVDLVRHGITDANRDSRVQGQMDWGLSDAGRDQARLLSKWIGEVDAVYTSPLGRAAQTADLAFADHDAEHLDGLMEIHMGEWEGRRWEDLVATDPALSASWNADEDFARGRTGETYAQLRQRATETVDSIANGSDGPRRIAAVSHGGTIGAYLRTLLHLEGPTRNRLGRLSNTAVSRVLFLEEGPLLIDFNVGYHLEPPSR